MLRREFLVVCGVAPVVPYWLHVPKLLDNWEQLLEPCPWKLNGDDIMGVAGLVNLEGFYEIRQRWVWLPFDRRDQWETKLWGKVVLKQDRLTYGVEKPYTDVHTYDPEIVPEMELE